VDLSSIQYRKSIEGIGGYGSWENAELTGINKEFQCSLAITFPNGDNNYLQWRAKDIAGNGWIESNDIRYNVSTTTPWLDDTDGDEIPDSWEISNGLNRTDPLDASADQDNDGLTNLEEYQNGTDILNSDSDYDGLTDDEELRIYFTEPLIADSDDDGHNDGYEVEKNTDPLDDSEYPGSTKDGDDNKIDYSWLILVLIILIIVIVLFFMLARRKKSEEREELEEEIEDSSNEDMDEDDDDGGEWKFADELSDDLEEDSEPDVEALEEDLELLDDDIPDSEVDIEDDLAIDLSVFDDTEEQATAKTPGKGKLAKHHKKMTKGIVPLKGKDKVPSAKKKGKQLKENLEEELDHDENISDNVDETDITKSKVKKKLKGKTEIKKKAGSDRGVTDKKKLDKPIIHTLDKIVKCNICFGNIKTGLNIITCSCGKHYHENCAKRVGVCPVCEIGLKDPENMTGDDK
jgi:hypothetical protein